MLANSEDAMMPTLPIDVFAARRSALLERMPDRSAALFLALPLAARNSDVVYPYRPGSDLWFLTGFDEPSAALLLTRGCGAPRSVLFLRDRDPAQEQWTGTRVGVEEAPAALGVDAAHPIDRLTEELPGLIARAHTLIHAEGRGDLAERVRKALVKVRGGPRGPYKGPLVREDPALTLHEIRLRKSPEEVDRIRRANQISDRAFRRAMTECEPGTGEWEIQAWLEEGFRAGGGWGWAYPTIVAGGPRACVLHYDRNAAPCEAGQLVLVDAGAEVDGYAADVSRTFPVSRRFTAAQRDIYQLVLDAQLAALEAIAPGATLEQLHDRAVQVLARGMVDLGLLDGPLDQVVEQGSYKRYYPHQTSHWLGLDVHDVGRYFVDEQPRPLEPGMVFTVEPGLYVPAADETAPPAMRGVGVRIEDDVLVTAEGHDNLSEGIPKEIGAIEALKG
jgi:Xaa-Pro aminopeptidase